MFALAAWADISLLLTSSASANLPSSASTSARFCLTMRTGARARRRLAQCVFGDIQLLGQGVGKSEIAEDGRVARRDLESLAVEPLRAYVVVEAVVDRALNRRIVQSGRSAG